MHSVESAQFPHMAHASDADMVTMHEEGTAVWSFSWRVDPGVRILAYGDSLTAGYHRNGLAFWCEMAAAFASRSVVLTLSLPRAGRTCSALPPTCG